jgi:hypothetical protein
MSRALEIAAAMSQIYFIAPELTDEQRRQIGEVICGLNTGGAQPPAADRKSWTIVDLTGRPFEWAGDDQVAKTNMLHSLQHELGLPAEDASFKFISGRVDGASRLTGVLYLLDRDMLVDSHPEPDALYLRINVAGMTGTECNDIAASILAGTDVPAALEPYDQEAAIFARLDKDSFLFFYFISNLGFVPVFADAAGPMPLLRYLSKTKYKYRHKHMQETCACDFPKVSERWAFECLNCMRLLRD